MSGLGEKNVQDGTQSLKAYIENAFKEKKLPAKGLKPRLEKFCNFYGGNFEGLQGERERERLKSLTGLDKILTVADLVLAFKNAHTFAPRSGKKRYRLLVMAPDVGIKTIGRLKKLLIKDGLLEPRT